MKGKIISIKPNHYGELIGTILTDEGNYHQFDRFNLSDKAKSLEDYNVGDIVQFKLFTNEKGIRYANYVKAFDESREEFVCRHEYGEFKRYIFINTRRVAEALKRTPLEEGFDNNLDIENLINLTYKTIASTYNNLCDDDFIFGSTPDGVPTLQIPTGISTVDGRPIMLFCTKNPKEKESGVPWYTEKVICGADILGSSIFDYINGNWYTIADDINELSPTSQIELETLLSTIERRNANRDGFIWLRNGCECDEQSADSLFVPTNYFSESGKEIYLSCVRLNGFRGYGWYYRYAIYENAPLEVYTKGEWLFKWASLTDESQSFTDICRELAGLTLEEKWTFTGGKPFGILKNYLKYTFAHQWKDNKISYSRDKTYAAFNTGLPDKNTYKYLYMLFERIPEQQPENVHPLYFNPKYKFLGIAKAGAGGHGKILTSNIYPLPTPPQYFKSRSDTVWNLDFNDSSQISMPECDDAHILIRRCERLPIDFYRSCASYSPRLRSIIDDENLSLLEKYQKIRQFLLPVEENSADAETTNVYRELVASLNNKIYAAIRKLSWNWRAVVPCYNPERGEPCYLLPISFCDPDIPDRALIATANQFEDGCTYTIHTVLPLDWAYLDARLVCRPESEWLGTNILSEVDIVEGDVDEDF